MLIHDDKGHVTSLRGIVKLDAVNDKVDSDTITPDHFHHEPNLVQEFFDFGSIYNEPFSATLL